MIINIKIKNLVIKYLKTNLKEMDFFEYKQRI